MIKPKILKSGDRVALIAPSSPVSEEKLERSLESVGFLGLIPVLYPSCTMKNGYLAGTDNARAKDVNDAFANPSIDGIFCLRGGFGATKILPLLDYNLIKKNPKMFLGYSDITALHIVLNQRCELVTVHGPMPTRGYHTLDYLSLQSLTYALFCEGPIGLAPTPPDEPIEILCPGTAEGLIIGGNLSVMAAALGSPYEVDTKGKILFIEDVDERPYRLDRNLTALALAGKFEDCAGIILGTFADCEEPELEENETLTLTQIFDQVIKPFGKPTINNFRAGHIYPQVSIPMGVRTRLDAINGTVEFLT
ncbi:MAG: LD-carboxypeptidase [Eubacteriales bacterium]|nr:LD-carboxypeptidase [Eubacteriales bacterium]MDD4583689.1 LD-carboxypeptidase [Eubacteriales bacterium]